MARMQNPNIDLLENTVKQLGNLSDEMVFVGGSITGLLITDPAAPPIRPTKDVDAIVQVVSIIEYHRLATRLRQKGFCEDSSEGAPICRWKASELLLDVMPTEESVFGFGNAWYKEAINSAQKITLPSGKTIPIISAPYFLLTKLDAFAGRGQNDFLASHDMEDIIAVIDGRPGLIEEVKQVDLKLKHELAKRFKALEKNNSFIEAIPGHLGYASASSARMPTMLKIIHSLADLE